MRDRGNLPLLVITCQPDFRKDIQYMEERNNLLCWDRRIGTALFVTARTDDIRSDYEVGVALRRVALRTLNITFICCLLYEWKLSRWECNMSNQ